MDWEQIDIYINPADADVFTDRLIMNGIEEFVVTDPRDVADLKNTSIYFDYIDDELTSMRESKITIYLNRNEEYREKKRIIYDQIQEASRSGVNVRVDMEDIAEEDWMNSWKRFYKPLEIGRNLLIKPSWEEIPEGNTRTVVEIDPSSSFGTGTHETTRLCMMMLEDDIKGDEHVLDMGCGSGILGVTALLLGAQRALLIDVEDDSMTAVSENMERNHIDPSRYSAVKGNVLEDEVLRKVVSSGSFDVITANIVSDIVIAMKELFRECLKESGVLITSGIIIDRIDEVRSAYEEAGFKVKNIKIEGEWAAIRFVL